MFLRSVCRLSLHSQEAIFTKPMFTHAMSQTFQPYLLPYFASLLSLHMAFKTFMLFTLSGHDILHSRSLQMNWPNFFYHIET